MEKVQPTILRLSGPSVPGAALGSWSGTQLVVTTGVRCDPVGVGSSSSRGGGAGDISGGSGSAGYSHSVNTQATMYSKSIVARQLINESHSVFQSIQATRASASASALEPATWEAYSQKYRAQLQTAVVLLKAVETEAAVGSSSEDGGGRGPAVVGMLLCRKKH